MASSRVLSILYLLLISFIPLLLATTPAAVNNLHLTVPPRNGDQNAIQSTVSSSELPNLQIAVPYETINGILYKVFSGITAALTKQ
jgi:hypothetical protein